MKRFVLILIVIALLGAGVWYVIKRRGAGAPAEEEKSPIAKVEVTTLKRDYITDTSEGFGIVAQAPAGDHVISATFETLISKVYVSAGTKVNEGDVMLEIEPSPDARLLLESAKSALALANRSLVATQERYDLKLANSTDLIAAQQLKQDAELKAASYEKRLQTDGKIVAPVDGLVSTFTMSAGALVPIGTPLVTVTGEENLEVRLSVEVSETPELTPGQNVTLLSANRVEPKPIQSTIRTISRNIDPATGAAEVRVPVPKDATLLLGEHVKGSIELDKKKALIAPRTAVLPDDEKQIMFTVKNGKAVKHEVTVGIATDELVEVKGAGLQEGDQVVVLGNYELEDGMAVQAVEKVSKDEKDAKSEKGAADAKGAAADKASPDTKDSKDTKATSGDQKEQNKAKEEKP